MPFLILLILLASCGGGGGGGSTSSSETTTTITISEQWKVTNSEANAYRTEEYARSYSISGEDFESYNLELINAAEAYAVLDKNGKEVAGDGVSIAIVDTGVQTDHEEIAANYDSANSYDFYNDDSNPADGDGHGTNVASIAAGVKDASGIHGVAYESTIMAFKALSDSGSTSDINNISDSIYAAISNGASVINLSLGGSSDVDNIYKNALLAAKTADILTVAATGNDGNSQPDYPAYYAANSSLSGYVLAVGAVDEDSTIASFSNRCGNTKNYCLVAPGVEILGAYKSDGYAQASGTSQATPHVAGAAAVIRAAWPHLSASQTAQILLQSATDLGAKGVDSTYGHGLLNLYSAVQYQGDDILSYGTSSDSGGYKVSTSSFSSDPIFGDAFATNLSPALEDAIFLDEFGRDYKANLAQKISNNSANREINLDNFTNNNIASRSLPLSFGKNFSNQIRLNISSFKNSEANNIYGLKFITLDNSQDPQKNLSQGFSFTHNLKSFAKGSKFGFSFNIDELADREVKDFYETGFMTQKNLASNPFNQFLSNSGQAEVQRQFNQAFFTSEISQNLTTKFSYQSSFDSNQVLSQINQKQNEVYDFGLSLKSTENLSFLFSGGEMKEFGNNVLNSKASGAFETIDDTKTSYLKIASSYKLKNWHFLASISEGRTEISGNDKGIFRDFSNVKSRSSSVAMVYDDFFNGRLGFAYSEPLRVYQGSVKIDVPVARDLAGNLTRYQSTASLVPNGKQRDYEIFFNKNLSNNSQIGVNLIRQFQAGNVADAQVNDVIFLKYGLHY